MMLNSPGRRLIGNLYWTSRGLGYRVDSPEKARRYNTILVSVVGVAILAVVAVLVL